MRAAIERVEIDMKELEALLERARAGPLSDEDYKTLRKAIDALRHLIETNRRQQRTTEKTRKVLEETGAELPNSAEEQRSPERQSKGHGRNGAEAYRGAQKIAVLHQTFRSGDSCPECRKGKVYTLANPGVLVRIVGQAPIEATVYELQKLRCNLCGEVYTAEAPAGIGAEKYDATSASVIGLLKYGSGVPFYRLEGFQESLGIPLPASTQWEIVEEAASVIAPAYEELIRQAAQGEVLYNDDTSIKILKMAKDSSGRTGVFTSGIVSTREGRKIALFFSGRKHAGENLTDVLARRAAEVAPPIQMCDALSRNLPKELEAILANCIAHARRRFVEVAENFPDKCRHVLETLGEVYRNDALAREQGMPPDERLNLHKARSGPLMDGLQNWMMNQLVDRKVEPNSGLGRAITYFLRHWETLTLFLRQPGAPLDNNICERALKKAILHRKNSLFYQTPKGARVGDIFMSLIHTCQLCAADPFDYLTELQRHSEELATKPGPWMPWNYRKVLENDSTSAVPG
jgi:transposase